MFHTQSSILTVSSDIYTIVPFSLRTNHWIQKAGLALTVSNNLNLLAPYHQKRNPNLSTPNTAIDLTFVLTLRSPMLVYPIRFLQIMLLLLILMESLMVTIGRKSLSPQFLFSLLKRYSFPQLSYPTLEKNQTLIRLCTDLWNFFRFDLLFLVPPLFHFSPIDHHLSLLKL